MSSFFGYFATKPAYASCFPQNVSAVVNSCDSKGNSTSVKVTWSDTYCQYWLFELNSEINGTWQTPITYNDNGHFSDISTVLQGTNISQIVVWPDDSKNWNDRTYKSVTNTCKPPTPTPSPTNAATPTPSGPTATPTPAPATLLNIALQLPGIGKGGNLNPNTKTRSLHLSLYAAGVDPSQPNIHPVFDSKNFHVQYDSSTGYFTNDAVDVGNLPTGDYQLLVKSPGYLRKAYADATSDTKTIHITSQTTTLVPAITLIAGDIGPLFNVIDASDFYSIVSCYGGKANASSCAVGAQIADINDDGTVDGKDLNYWLLGFQTLVNNNNTDGNGDGVTGD